MRSVVLGTGFDIVGAERHLRWVHISAIRVENFRSFRELKLEDLPPAVVVLGENNAGKSNLLEALRLVLDPGMADRRRYLTAEDFWVGCDAPLDGDEIRVEAELTAFDDDQRLKAALRDSCVGDDPLTARLTYLYRPRPGGAGGGDYEARLFGGDDESNEITLSRRREIALTVLPALRDAQADLAHPFRSPLQDVLRLTDVGDEALEAVAEAIAHANDRLLDEEPVKRVEKALADQVVAMVGETHGVQVGLGVSSPVPAQVLRAVRVLVEGGFPLERTGLGATNVIYLALLLQRFDVQRERDQIAGSLVAVEEPEANLHPHVQRVLFAFLMRNASLLVTTHSAHIASVSKLRSIVMLKRDGSETVGYRAASPEMSAQVRADLERYLDVNRADILFAKAVILVEGIAERYTLPEVAASVGVDLDALGITVCSVEGTDFLPYILLLDALAIPHAVVTDGDPNDDGERVGLRRCVALLGEDEREEVQDLADEDEVQQYLTERGFFVNGSTLELEYAATAPDALRAAYEDLVTSEISRERMSDSLRGVAEGDAAAAKQLVRRIAATGKGRFAQRCVDYLRAEQHPRYLINAVEWLREELSG